jgi:hypothetical protein
METLKIDRTKLRTVKNYAKDQGLERQRVYYLIRTGKLTTEVIDGVTFIKLA